jgi:hypothetical protein
MVDERLQPANPAHQPPNFDFDFDVTSPRQKSKNTSKLTGYIGIQMLNFDALILNQFASYESMLAGVAS